MTTLRRAILFAGVLGTFVFGSAFVASFVAPVAVERLVKDLVRRQVQREVEERIDELQGGQLARLASRLVAGNDASIVKAKRALAADLPGKVASVVAEMQDPDCPCRAFVQTAVSGYLNGVIVANATANDRLTALIRVKYIQVTESLMREFRIVAAANALMFVILAAVALRRGRAALQLALPAIILIVGASTVGLVYVFGQNWLHTVLFSDYVGFAYFGYLGIVILFLADVAFNRAQITTVIVNAAFNFVGAAIQAVPC